MPDEGSEEGFTVRDRRRFTGEPTAASTTTEPPPPSAPPSVVEPLPSSTADFLDEDAIDDGAREDIYGAEDAGALPDVYSVLALFLGELRNLAWLRMGLVANPATNQIERDMDQAKVAIDTVTFLASQLESVVAPEEKLPLKALVSDLQINFVEQNKRAGSGGGA